MTKTVRKVDPDWIITGVLGLTFVLLAPVAIFLWTSGNQLFSLLGFGVLVVALTAGAYTGLLGVSLLSDIVNDMPEGTHEYPWQTKVEVPDAPSA